MSNLRVYDPRACRNFRTRNQLTLTEVAGYCSVPRELAENWETARAAPTHNEAIQLAQLLKVRAVQLYRWAELDTRASRELLLATLIELQGVVRGALSDKRLEAGRTRAQHFSPQRFRQARELAKWTQARLASEVGVHRVTLVRWEKGQMIPDRALIGKAAALLQKPSNWFYVQEAVQTTRAARVELGSLLYECCRQNLSYDALAERAQLEAEQVEAILEETQSAQLWELEALRCALGLARPDVETTMNDAEVRQELSLLSAAIEELLHSETPVGSAILGGACLTRESE